MGLVSASSYQERTSSVSILINSSRVEICMQFTIIPFHKCLHLVVFWAWHDKIIANHSSIRKESALKNYNFTGNTAKDNNWLRRNKQCDVASVLFFNSPVSDFIFLGSKITAYGDCSHEIKRRLLLGRKVMTNLDSIFKSRDITFPTKIRLVKATAFPVVCMDVRVGF